MFYLKFDAKLSNIQIRNLFNSKRHLSLPSVKYIRMKSVSCVDGIYFSFSSIARRAAAKRRFQSTIGKTNKAKQINSNQGVFMRI